MNKPQTVSEIASDSIKNLIGSQALMLAQVGAELVVAQEKIKELEAKLAEVTKTP